MSDPDKFKPKISNELQPDLREDPLTLESFLVAQKHHNGRSAQLLSWIDELDRRIAAETPGTASRRQLCDSRSGVAQEFAKHLDANPYSRQWCFVADDGRYVRIVVEVLGTPSRAGRTQAQQWMASRGQPWTGDIKKLRAAVRGALRVGDKLPADYFGLWVERTVRIVDQSFDPLHFELPKCIRS